MFRDILIKTLLINYHNLNVQIIKIKLIGYYKTNNYLELIDYYYAHYN